MNVSVCTSAVAPREPTPGTLGAVIGTEKEGRTPAEAMWVGLLRAMAAGDEHALHELYAHLHRLVFTLILRIVRDRETAEELTLDVFHEAWRRSGDYDERGGTVIGWIMNQARSRAIDRVRFEHRKKRRVPALHIEAPITTGAEVSLDEALRGRVVRNALNSLTAHERQAIETAYFADRSYLEVADMLGVPPGTIKTRIRSALIKLRRVLAEEGGSR